MRKLLVLLATLLAVTAHALGAVTTASVNVRATPSSSAAKVALLPAGTNLQLSSCGVTWCTLTAPSHGYVARAFVRLTPAAPVASNPGTYTNVDGVQVQRPTFSETVPSGASAKCRDGSYSFSTHRRGTCSHHGGVDSWY